MKTLREVRTDRLLTMRELAAKAGVAFSTIYLIENDKTTPRLPVIRKLSEALGVEAREIEEFSAAIDASLEGKEVAVAAMMTTATAS